MLTLKYYQDKIEAGCDEAGRGCLAGPVFAAAVILPEDFSNEMLNDSKQLSEKKRDELRSIIEREALAWRWPAWTITKSTKSTSSTPPSKGCTGAGTTKCHPGTYSD